MTSFDHEVGWEQDGYLVGFHELLDPVRLPYLVRQFRSHGAVTILDAGCGAGILATALAAAGFRVAGVDVTPPVVRLAADDGVSAAVADAARLPFEDASFDGVLLADVLEHAEDPESVFGDAARVVRPGGVVAVTGPNRTLLGWLVLIGLAQEWPTRVLPRGLHDYAAIVRPEQLGKWGAEYGLDVVDVTGIGIRMRDVPAALRALTKLRLGAMTHGAAGRSIRLIESSLQAVTFMATAVKRDDAHS